MDWALISLPLAGGIRSVAGWLEGALKDGRIDPFEWGKLLGTIVEVATISAAAILGLGLDAVSASGIGVLASFFFSKLKA